MNKSECIRYVESHMEVCYATSNGAYTAGRKITPGGCVNHSVGCAQPSADVFFRLMNKSSAGWGVNAILGDFHKGEGRILVALPLDARPWGCGAGSKGSWNNTRIQWETCEPAGHTYAGGTMIGYDVEKNQEYFDRMWKMLVAWNVYIAEKFQYPASCIADHAESYKAGMGSNHSDMGQWLPKHGKSMAALRAEVSAIMAGETNSESEDDDDMVRYKRLSEIPESCNFRNIVDLIMSAGIMGGDGSDPDGNNDVIDISHDMVRMFVMHYRAGCYDEKIRAAGLDPDLYK